MATILVIGLLHLSSCEKVIDIELETSPNQIVIEGNITDRLESQTIKLSSQFPTPTVIFIRQLQAR